MKKIILIILTIVSTVSLSQKDSLLETKIAELSALFENYVYAPHSFQDISLEALTKVSELEVNQNLADQSIYLSKRAEQLKKDLGISIAGNYVENFDLDPLEDIEQNINYRRRAQLGVQWDVLNNGYYENQIRAQILEDRILREKLNTDLTKESHYYLKRFDYTVFAFNQLKIDLLNERKSTLEKQEKVIRDLFLLKKIKKEQLIRTQMRLSEVTSLIHVYKSYNNYLNVPKDSMIFGKKELPLIDLNYEAIFSKIGLQTDQLLANDNYVEYFKWYHQFGLRPFARYSYYDVITTNDRSFFTAGVNFTIPLQFDTKLKNEVEHEKWRYENERFIQDRAALQEEVLNTAYDFRVKLKDFVDQYQRRKLLNERLRIEKAKMNLNEHRGDPFEGLDLYDDLLAIEIKLLEKLQGLYLNALKIHSKIPQTKIEELVKVNSKDEMLNQHTRKQRSVYVWSKTFEENEAGFLAEYAVYNEFNKTIIAVTDNAPSTVKKEFLTYTAENGAVYFMLGNNKLFYEEDLKGYLKRVLEINSTVTPVGIHIDVEPHTFENWETEKMDLQKKYVQFVRKVKAFCEERSLKLEIAVPKHYDYAIMNELFGLVDHVYFMCYENVKTDFLVRKLKPYVDDYPDKVVIALRTEDFSNRLEMENKMDELQKELGIESFAYHDLRRMVNFDKRVE